MKVVIVGAGVIGASVAHHLAARGATDVLLLDRGPGPGAGSTGRATGGYRATFTTAIQVRLSLLSRAKLLRFAEETGVDPGYQPHGYLWLAEEDAALARLRAALAVQQAEGLDEAREVDPDEARRLSPAVPADGVRGGVFCPSDGFLRPLAILEGYLGSARRQGARVEWDAEVVALERTGDRITSVRTRGARHPADVVIDAAGPWASPVAALAGVSLPVAALRRQVLPTQPQDVLPPSMPMTLFSDGFHLRVRDGRVLLLWPDPAPEGEDTRVDPRWIDAVTAAAHARVPALRAVPIDRAGAYAGLYEMSPDRHAIVGVAPGCPNLLLANGSSGHGVMHSPILGQLVAELVTGALPSVDLAPLRPTRFAEGAPNPSTDL